MVDVDSIKGCAVQSEAVFHCSEASQSTTKVTKHSAATAGQIPLGTGREFLVEQRRIFGTNNRETSPTCSSTASPSFGSSHTKDHPSRRYRRYLSASILIGIDVPEERQRQVPTNQMVQRTVERTQVRVYRDMYRSSRTSRRLLRHHKLSRENADHPEDPEDC